MTHIPNLIAIKYWVYLEDVFNLIILLSLGALGLKYILSNRRGVSKSWPGSRVFCSRSCRFRINLKLVQGGRSIRGGFWQRIVMIIVASDCVGLGAGVKSYRPQACDCSRGDLTSTARWPRSVRRTIVVNRHLVIAPRVNPFTARSS